MHSRKLNGLLATVAMLGTASAAELPKPGMELFNEDFSSVGTFAERWVFDGDTVSKDGIAVVAGKLDKRSETPADFYLSVDCTTPKSDSADAKAGVRIGWAEFVVPCDGATHQLVVTRRVVDGKAFFVWSVDGNVSSLEKDSGDPSNAGFKTLSFVKNGIDAFSVDNVVVKALKSEGESPNIIVNSSFEYDYDGYPYYADGSISYRNRGREWFNADRAMQSFLVDKKFAHSGKQSLRMTLTPESKIGILRTNFIKCSRAADGKAWVLSAWIKGDRNGIFVVLNAGGARKTVQVSTEWQRYELVFFKRDIGQVILEIGNGVTKNADNVTIWVDDMQSEAIEGDVTPEDVKANPDKLYATEYQVCARDASFFAPRKAPERAQAFSIPMLPAGVEPSWKLDSWKDKAVMVDRYYSRGKLIPKRTEAYFAVDSDNLYIAQRYYGDNIEWHRIGDENEHLNQRGAEIMISSFDKEKWVHFGGSARKARFDIGFGEDSNWNGIWSIDGGMGSDTNIVDFLFTFPLANIADPNLRNPLTLMIGRNDYGHGGVGPWSLGKNLMGINYRAHEFWPEATLPDSIAKKYSLGVSEVVTVPRADTERLVVRLANNSGVARENVRYIVTKVEADGTRDVIGQKTGSFPEGNSEIDFGVVKNLLKVNIRIYEGDKFIFDRNFSVLPGSPVALLNKLSFYMNEPDAEFEVAYTGSVSENTRGVLECGNVKVENIAISQRFRVKMPLKDLADGTYNAVFTIYDGTEAIASATDKVVKLPFAKGASQVNHFSRAVELNGKPTVPISLFRDPGFLTDDQENDLLYLQTQGFRTTHLLLPVGYGERVRSYNRPHVATNWLNMCGSAGIPLIYWHGHLGEKKNVSPHPQLDEEDALPRYVAYLRDGMENHGWTNILAHVLFDEPELDGSRDQSCVEAVMNRYRELFPYTPIMMNNTYLGVPSNYANLSTDIFMIDDYLTNDNQSWKGRTVASVLRNYDVMWEKGKAKGLPVWFFMVGGNMQLHGREPTYREQIAQSYGALASGCTGLSYFYGFIATPGDWRAVKQIAREVGEIEPMLTSSEFLPKQVSVNSDKDHVRCIAKLYEGYLYVIACNIDEGRVNGLRFTLPDCFEYEGEAEILFEKRKIPVRNGVISENLDGHTRRVYKVKVLNK